MYLARRPITIFAALAAMLSLGMVSSHATRAAARGSLERDPFNRPGNILVSDQFNNRAVEIDPHTSQIVWTFGSGRPDGCNPGTHTIIGLNDAERLSHGLTLMAGTGIPPGVSPALPGGCVDNRVIVVTDDGAIIWQYGQAGQTGMTSTDPHTHLLNVPVFAIQLPNTDFMIVDQGNNRVIEVNKFRQIVWQYGAANGASGMGANQLNNPNSAELLANGNVLIADENNNRAIEVTPNRKTGMGGTLVKTFTAGGTVSGMAFASRLPNGDTLLTDSGNSRIVEVNGSDGVVWQYFTNVPQPPSNPNPLPTNAVRLASGQTSIADQFNNRVLIVNANKQITFQYGMTNHAGNGPGQLNGPYTSFVIGDYTGQTPPPAHF